MHFTAEKDDFTVQMHDGVDTTASAPVPVGFLIPLAWKNIADELALQGVVMERTPKAHRQVRSKPGASPT